MVRGNLPGAVAAHPVLFARSPSPAWLYDRATLAVVEANDVAREQLGLSSEALAGRTLRDVVVAEDLDALVACLAAEGEAEVRFATSAGVRVLVVRAEPCDDATGLAVAVDVTEARGAATKLSMAEKRLASLLANSGEAIVLVDAEHVVTYVSPAVERILGYAPGEIVGRRAGLLMDETDQEAVRSRHQGMLRSRGAMEQYLTRVRHKDGTKRWIESVVTNLLDEPAVGAIVGQFRDVTARVEAEQAARRAEEALRLSEASFRTVVEHLPSAIFIHDDHAIVYANRALSQMLGYDADELRGVPPLAVATADEHDLVRARIARLTAQTPYNGPREGKFLKKGGAIVQVETESMRVGYGGKPATLVIARDIGAQRASLARMAATDRMLSLATLAAGVAHEINNPLAYVLTNLTLLSDELPSLLRGGGRLSPPQVEELLRDACDGAARVRDVVRDLRLMSSRDDEVSGGPTDLREVLESTVKIARDQIQGRAKLVTRFERTPPVRASSWRLGQVFLNILVNAAQAIPEGRSGDEVRVSCSVLDDAHAVVEISDTGVGIAPEHLGRIFEPFFTTKPMGVGTGLGLAICHGIVRSIEGRIDVDSAPGRGSTFRVVLPLAESAVATTPSRVVAAPSRRARVLVVDDEASIATTMRMLLSSDHDVVSFTSPREALAYLEGRSNDVDVVFCDLMMPEMSGMDVFRAIERAKPSLAARVVFLTGGAFTADARAFLSSVGNPRLEKPFEPEQLAALVHRIVA